MPLCFGRFGMYRGPPKCVNILETLHKLEIFGNSTAEFQLNKGKSSSPTLFVPVVHLSCLSKCFVGHLCLKLAGQ